MIDLNRLKDRFYIEKDRFKSIIIENRSILFRNRDRQFDWNRWNPNQTEISIQSRRFDSGTLIALAYYWISLTSLTPIIHNVFLNESSGFHIFALFFIAYLGFKIMQKRENAKTQFFATKITNEKMMQKQENTKTCLVCHGPAFLNDDQKYLRTAK